MNYWKPLLIGSIFIGITSCAVAPNPAPTQPPKSNSQQEQKPLPDNSQDTMPETYTVQKGDTVFSIMRETGVYWKDIIDMNNLKAPRYIIVPGQILILRDAVMQRDVTT